MPGTVSYTVVLDPEPVDRLRLAQERLARAEITGPPEAIDVARQAVAEAEGPAAEAVETLYLQGLGRDAYEALLLLHPPTEDQRSKKMTYNVDTMMSALIAATVIEPPGPAPQVRSDDLKVLADGGRLPGRALSVPEVDDLLDSWNQGETGELWNLAVTVCISARNGALPKGLGSTPR